MSNRCMLTEKSQGTRITSAGLACTRVKEERGETLRQNPFDNARACVRVVSVPRLLPSPVGRHHSTGRCSIRTLGRPGKERV